MPLLLLFFCFVSFARSNVLPDSRLQVSAISEVSRGLVLAWALPLYPRTIPRIKPRPSPTSAFRVRHSPPPCLPHVHPLACLTTSVVTLGHVQTRTRAVTFCARAVALTCTASTSQVLGHANRYIDQNQPWVLAKTPDGASLSARELTGPLEKNRSISLPPSALHARDHAADC